MLQILKAQWKYIVSIAISLGLTCSSFLLFWGTSFLCMNPMSHHPLAHPLSHFSMYIGYLFFWIALFLFTNRKLAARDISITFRFSALFSVPCTFLWIGIWYAGETLKQSFSEDMLSNLSQLFRLMDSPVRVLGIWWLLIIPICFGIMKVVIKQKNKYD